MDLKVAKTFDRLGRRYRPGDAPPPDLDKPTVQHYLRHGMLTEAAPAAPARRTRAAAPRQTTAAPAQASQHTGSAGPSEAGATGPQSAQQAGPSDAAALADAQQPGPGAAGAAADPAAPAEAP